MAVEDYLKSVRSSKQGPKYILSPTSGIINPKLGGATGGFRSTPVAPASDPNIESYLSNQIDIKKRAGSDFLTNYKNEKVTKLASDVVEKSAGNIPTNEWGIPARQRPNLNASFEQRSQTINQFGKSALQAEEAKAAWQEAKRIQGLGSYSVIPGTLSVYDPKNLPPGTNNKNPGGQAVAMAMTAFKNKTPYVWGGNSLVGGVDCSGLVQQVYSKLGIKLPRTTYEQAKSGRIVSLNSLLPGDLVFYNTGSRDPNGIGSLSHVAIYIGNGQVVEAYNTKHGIRVGSISYSGTPVRAVRPW